MCPRPDALCAMQGALGDCYLLCAMSALAEHPERITRLFCTSEVGMRGARMCRGGLGPGQAYMMIVDWAQGRHGGTGEGGKGHGTVLRYHNDIPKP